MRLINRLNSLESWLKLTLALAGLILLLTLSENSIRIANNEWAYNNNDQSQQIFEYYFDGGERLFSGDYISEYYLNAFLPSGFSGLYDAAGWLGDPFFFSKILSFALMLAFIFMVYMISKGYAGRTWGMVSVVMVFCSPVFFNRMAGGLPRSFAFPLGLFFFLGFIRRRPVWCAASLVAMALLYPPGLVPYTIIFALWLLFPGLLGTDAAQLPGLRPEASCLRRLFWLAGLCVLITLILAPTLYKSGQYGGRILLSDVGDFPESGPDGRYGRENTIEGKGILSELTAALPYASHKVFGGTGIFGMKKQARLYALLLLSCLSLYGLSGKRALARREVRYLIALSLAAIAGFAASVLVYPYAFLPQRSIEFTLPLVAHFAVLFGLVGVAGKFKPEDQPAGGNIIKRPGFKPWVYAYFPYIMAGVVLCFLVGKPVGNVKENNPELYGYIRRDLPKDAVFAGWPDSGTDGIPLLGRRRIIFGYETDQAFHKGYTLEMRKRGRALMDAYLSADPSALRRLRDEFGVTYLLVKLSYFEGHNAETPKTFEPLNGYASRLISSVPPDKRALWGLMPSLEIKRTGGYSILDLRKL